MLPPLPCPPFAAGAPQGGRCSRGPDHTPTGQPAHEGQGGLCVWPWPGVICCSSVPHQAADNSTPMRISHSLPAWEILCASRYKSAWTKVLWKPEMPWYEVERLKSMLLKLYVLFLPWGACLRSSKNKHLAFHEKKKRSKSHVVSNMDSKLNTFHNIQQSTYLCKYQITFCHN